MTLVVQRQRAWRVNNPSGCFLDRPVRRVMTTASWGARERPDFRFWLLVLKNQYRRECRMVIFLSTLLKGARPMMCGALMLPVLRRARSRLSVKPLCHVPDVFRQFVFIHRE